MSTETPEQAPAPDGLIRPTVDEATAALTAAAFEVTDPRDDNFGRKIVHCFAGFGLGAEWSLESALAILPTARDIAWMDHWCDHDLAVLDEDGRTRFFNVKRPAALSPLPDTKPAESSSPTEEKG